MDFSILSIYDDFLANYFLDNLLLWFPTIRMNSNTEYGSVNTTGAIPIIRQRVVDDLNPVKATKELIQLPYFQEFLRNKHERQISEFSQHMKRYMCMFMPSAGFEINVTTRYTGKEEACIRATQDWKVGQKVSFCQGSIAKLTAEEDERLKSEGRDFSVMVSTRKRCACLFLGPARFMNHDCDANCEFIIVGTNAVTFKVNKDIKEGDEMTVFYGKHYFGEDNCECLCASCERGLEGSYSKSVKTVVSNKASMKEDTSRIRRSNRKRKYISKGRDYGPEKRLKNKYVNHIDANDQTVSVLNDEHQQMSNNSVITNENAQQDNTTNDDSQKKEDGVAQSKDTTSLPDNTVQDPVTTEEENLTKRRGSTPDNHIQVSTDMTELHLMDALQELNGKLKGHDDDNGEMAIPEKDASNDSRLDEESVVPDVNTCEKEDISNEIEDVSALNGSAIAEIEDKPNANNEKKFDTPHQTDNVTIVTTNDDDDDLKEQTQEIVLSEGYKKPEIELSEGFKKSEIEFSEGLFQKTNNTLHEGKERIRQLQAVVIDLTSCEKDTQKSSVSTVCEVWIPAESDDDDDDDVKIALKELKQDIEKKHDLESATRNSLLRDMHVFAMKNSEGTDDERNETKEDWSSKSTSISIDLVSSHSETTSTCSISTPDNFNVRDEYTLTPEPDNRVWGIRNDDAPTSPPPDSLETRTNKDNSVIKVMKDSYTQSISNEDDGSITSSNPLVPQIIAPKISSQTLDISFVQHLDQQQENSEMMGDLCRSYTSSSNDSTCFSTNDFDTTDTNSSFSISSNNQDLQHQDVYSAMTELLKDKTAVDVTPASVDTHDITKETSPPPPLVVEDVVDSALSGRSVDNASSKTTNEFDTSERSIDLPTSIDTNINTEDSRAHSDENSNTNNDSSCLAIKIPSKAITIKKCCPNFDKYDTRTMCPRCTRHFEIFGFEWPKRAGKRPKNKTKPTKANQKLSTMPKRKKPLSICMNSQTPITLNGMQPQVSGLPQPENTPPKPSKPKVRKPYYYYELVRIDEVPEPEPILEHPSKPYALRRKKDESNEPPKKTPPKSSMTVDHAKKPKKRSPKTRPVTTKKVPQTSSKPQKSTHKKKGYYYYELVLEKEGPEEIPIIEVPDQPYPFRSKKKKAPEVSSKEGNKKVHFRTYVNAVQTSENGITIKTPNNTPLGKRSVEKSVYEPLSKRTCRTNENIVSTEDVYTTSSK